MSRKRYSSFEEIIDAITDYCDCKMQKIIDKISEWTVKTFRILFKLSYLLFSIMIPLILIFYLSIFVSGVLRIILLMFSGVGFFLFITVIRSVHYSQDIKVNDNIREKNKFISHRRIIYLGILMNTIVFLLYYFYMNNYQISDNFIISFICKIVGYIAGILVPLSNKLFS